MTDKNKLFSYDPEKPLKDNLDYVKFVKQSWNLDTKSNMPAVLLLCKNNDFIGSIFSEFLGFDVLYFALDSCKKMATIDKYIIILDTSFEILQSVEMSYVERKIVRLLKNLVNPYKEKNYLFLYECNNKEIINSYFLNYELEENNVIWKDDCNKLELQKNVFEKTIQEILKSEFNESEFYDNVCKILLGTSLINQESLDKIDKDTTLFNYLFSYLYNCKYLTLLNPKFNINYLGLEK